MRATLSLAPRSERPVVPVLLEDAPTVPDLPLFLQERTWVDLRSGADAGEGSALDLVVWGITGSPPDRVGDTSPPEIASRNDDRGFGREGQTVYAGSPNDRGPALEARPYQRHAELNAAVLVLSTPGEDVPGVELARDPFDIGRSRIANLWAVSADGAVDQGQPAEVKVRADRDSPDIVVTAEEAPRWGGVIEESGVVLGLVPACEPGEHVFRAVAVHRLLPWIDGILGAPRGPAPLPVQKTSALSAANLVLLERVREHVRKRLQDPDLEPIRRRWGTDPVADFDLSQPAVQLNARLWGLHAATRKSIPELAEKRRAVFRDKCHELYGELIKLAVDPQSVKGCDDLDALIRSGPGPLHVVCKLEVTDGFIYAATRDLNPTFRLDDPNRPPAYDDAIHFPSEIAGGIGEDRRQELLKKLWCLLVPDEGDVSDIIIEGDRLMQLRDGIARRVVADERHYLLIAPGTEDQLYGDGYGRWAKDLGIGLVLYEEDDRCPHLLKLEKSIKDDLRAYLKLLESI